MGNIREEAVIRTEKNPFAIYCTTNQAPFASRFEEKVVRHEGTGGFSKKAAVSPFKTT